MASARLRLRCPSDSVFRRTGGGHQPGLLRAQRSPRARGTAGAARRAGSGGRSHPGGRSPYKKPFFDSSTRRGPTSSDYLSQPEDAVPPDPQAVPGKAQDPFRSNGSRDQQRPLHQLEPAGIRGA